MGFISVEAIRFHGNLLFANYPIYGRTTAKKSEGLISYYDFFKFGNRKR